MERPLDPARNENNFNRKVAIGPSFASTAGIPALALRGLNRVLVFELWRIGAGYAALPKGHETQGARLRQKT
jgi:hypothetical protein